MCCSRVCLFLLAATVSSPTLHAATHNSVRRLAAAEVAVHHTDAATRHLTFPHRLPPAFDLPAQPAQSSVNPSASAHALSLTSFAVHSVLGLFARPTR